MAGERERGANGPQEHYHDGERPVRHQRGERRRGLLRGVCGGAVEVHLRGVPPPVHRDALHHPQLPNGPVPRAGEPSLSIQDLGTPGRG
eukprot:3680881-Pyramimonas_sp.AAC.1